MPLWHKDVKTNKTKQQVQKDALTVPFFFLKAGEKTPRWKMSSLHGEESNILIIKDRKLESREFCTKRTC